VGASGSDLGRYGRERAARLLYRDANASSVGRLLHMSTPTTLASKQAEALVKSMGRAEARASASQHLAASGAAAASSLAAGTFPLERASETTSPGLLVHPMESALSSHRGGAASSFKSESVRLDLEGPRPGQRILSNPPLGTQLQYDYDNFQAVKLLDGSRESSHFTRRERPPLYEAQTGADLAYGAAFSKDREIGQDPGFAKPAPEFFDSYTANLGPPRLY